MDPIIAVLAAPLLTFTTLLVFSRRYFTVFAAVSFASVNMTIAFCTSIYLYTTRSFDTVMWAPLWRWLSISGIDIDVTLRYDSLTAIMFMVVTSVSLLVHIYSAVYMYTDPFLARFMSYLSLFSFFMLVLVSSGNFWILFLGWEGVGLSSYLLIGFWYTRAQAGKAASKAFLVNKIGDLFLLTSISIIFTLFSTLDFSPIAVLAPFMGTSQLSLLSFFLLIGAVGKSAQVGLHSWLPDAMEGPTPVSSLIHAATMVTAGVFLLVRSSFILEYTPNVLTLIAVWGGLTALISGTIGATQNDIKKIIAYSTCSQLGYMVLACGLSAYNASFFHLFNHAFFKAALFLSAGSVIHIMGNEQDIRKMGGLSQLAPFIYLMMLVTSLALAGAPFLSGFYSKDHIIEVAITKFWSGGMLLYWMAIVSAALTAVYSFRLLEQVFWSDYGGFKSVLLNHVKPTKLEIGVLLNLLLLSLASGYLFRDVFIGFGSQYFSHVIPNILSTWNPVEAEFAGLLVKVLPLVITALVSEIEGRFLECKWMFNEVVNGNFMIPLLSWSRHLFEQTEKLLLEENGVIYPVAALSRVLGAQQR